MFLRYAFFFCGCGGFSKSFIAIAKREGYGNLSAGNEGVG